MNQEIYDISNYFFNAYSVPSFLIAVTIPLLILTVFFRERLTDASRAYAILGLCASNWFFTFAIMYCSNHESIALFWAKAGYLTVPLLPAAILHFTFTILNSYSAHNKSILICWIVSFIFSAFAVGTDMFITGVYHYPWGYYPAYGFSGVLFILFFGLVMVSVLHQYASELGKDHSAIHKRRIKSYLIGVSIAYFGFVDFLPKYGISIYPVGCVPIFALILISARSIWMHRLQDISPALAAENIIDTMSEGLLVIDLKGVIRIANQSAADIFETEKDLLTGKHISVIMEENLFNDNYEMLCNNRPVRDVETSFNDSHSVKKSLSYSMTLLRDSSDEAIAVVCAATDITSRRLAEEELRRYHAGLEDLVKDRTRRLEDINNKLLQEISSRKKTESDLTDRMHLSSLIADVGIALTRKENVDSILQSCAEGLVTHLDALFARIWLYNEMDNVLELRTSAGLYTHTDGCHSRIPFGKFKIGLIAKEQKPHLTKRVVGDPRINDQDWVKREKIVSFAGQPLVVGNKLVGVMAMFSRNTLPDSTIQGLSTIADVVALGVERKHAEESLRNAKEEIEAWNKELELRVQKKTKELLNTQAQLIQSEKLSAMGKMAGGLAHELNSPLAGLLPMIEKFKDSAEEGTKEHNELSLMLKACNHMAGIIKDFGVFSRESKGTMTTLNLEELIEDTLSFSSAKLRNKGIKIVKEYADISLKVQGIKTELQQVILNIITNACDATHENGEFIIRTGTSGDNGTVQMDFIDNGDGIQKEDMDKIFDPFFTTKKQGEGTGLGLSVSYGITKKHGGIISVQSEPEKGTTFTVTLPAIESNRR